MEMTEALEHQIPRLCWILNNSLSSFGLVFVSHLVRGVANPLERNVVLCGSTVGGSFLPADVKACISTHGEVLTLAFYLSD